MISTMADGPRNRFSFILIGGRAIPAGGKEGGDKYVSSETRAAPSPERSSPRLKYLILPYSLKQMIKIVRYLSIVGTTFPFLLFSFLPITHFLFFTSLFSLQCKQFAFVQSTFVLIELTAKFPTSRSLHLRPLSCVYLDSGS